MLRSRVEEFFLQLLYTNYFHIERKYVYFEILDLNVEVHPYTRLLPSAPDVSSWVVRTEFDCKSVKFVLCFSKNICCKLSSSCAVGILLRCIRKKCVLNIIPLSCDFLPPLLCLRIPGRLMH